MRIIRAQHLGMCFGVRDAIALAHKASTRGPLTILGELVHNETVVEELRQAGIQVETRLEKVQTDRALITAHGTSQRTLQAARRIGLEVAEATCPLVHHAHRAVAEFVRNGYYPVIVGKPDHVEVRGITDDLVEFTVILSDEDLPGIPPRPKIGVAAQTTQPISKVRRLVELIRARFPQSEVAFADTVCLPTKQRQLAATELAHKSDLVIVIGGAHSNNTRELVQTCSRACARVYHVQGPEDLKTSWFKQADVVGITAGTSTPDSLIDAVEARIQEFAKQESEALCLCLQNSAGV